MNLLTDIAILIGLPLTTTLMIYMMLGDTLRKRDIFLILLFSISVFWTSYFGTKIFARLFS